MKFSNDPIQQKNETRKMRKRIGVLIFIIVAAVLSGGGLILAAVGSGANIYPLFLTGIILGAVGVPLVMIGVFLMCMYFGGRFRR